MILITTYLLLITKHVIPTTTYVIMMTTGVIPVTIHICDFHNTDAIVKPNYVIITIRRSQSFKAESASDS